jgi:DNA-binding SARP family transcriptional activator/tetratricopeptide (TPR) repeat protein
MSRSAAPSSDGILSIYLFGTPAVVWAGEPLSIPRRHVRGLLYHLAAQTAPCAREHLCLLLWPDIPEASAHRNLTRTLTHLRRALPTPTALLADKETVLLDEKQFWCDVVQFRRLMQVGADIRRLEQAVDFYRGDFLEGFYLPGCLEFERWISLEGTALEHIYLEALSCLLEAKTGEKDYASAILYAHRYLETDELAEEIHRRLISLYALSRDRSRALRQFETCASILERELGARPLPETRAIYQAVLEGRPIDLQTGWLETSSRLSPKKLLPVKTPLVGRTIPMRHLENGMRQVRAGQSKVVLISGEPGIGKSRLLGDFAERCRTQHHVLQGAGQLAEVSVPYHPIVEALRSASISLCDSPSPIWCTEVARILPELHSLIPDLPAPVSLKGEEARIRLFEALCHYIFALQTDSQPILLCFDDLHWFDRTSLSWFIHLCRQFAMHNRPVMVIGTYRKEDAGRIKELRDNLARLGLLDELHLTGLDEHSILELCQQLFTDFTASKSFASRLRKATGGNPFFILETLRALEEENKLAGSSDQLADFPLPKGVREAVNRRLGRLNPRSRQVVEAGAILGPIFDFKVVRLTAGRSELETSSALDLLVNNQLLTEELNNFRFSHDLVRKATLAAISPMRLRLLHSRAGKALEKLEPEAVPALADHFDAGGEWSRALHYHELSASRAEALFAWQEAEMHLERALQNLALLDPGSTDPGYLAKRFQVLSKLNQLHYLHGRLDQRDNDLQRMQDLAETTNDAPFKLQTLLLKVQNLNSDANYQDGIATAERGLVLAEQLVERGAHARLLAQIGLGYHMLGQPVKALSALQAASSEIEESSDKPLHTLILVVMAQVYRVLGDYRHALSCAQDAYAIHRELGDPYGAARYVDIGYLYANLGLFQEAHHFLDECLATARKASVRSYEAHALLAIGGTCLSEGDPIAAIDNCQTALGILEGLRSENLVASAAAVIGFAYYHLGILDQGRHWLERSLDAARAIGHRMRIAQVLFQLSLLEISADQMPSADSKVQEGLTIAREIRSAELISVGLAIAARIKRLSGTSDKAKGYAQEALHYAQQHDLLAVEMLTRVELALALVELGNFAPALEHTGTAIFLIPSAHQLWISAEQVHHAHAKVLKRMGIIQTAEEHECIARAIMQEKADRIPDPTQRASFLAKSQQVY